MEISALLLAFSLCIITGLVYMLWRRIQRLEDLLLSLIDTDRHDEDESDDTPLQSKMSSSSFKIDPRKKKTRSPLHSPVSPPDQRHPTTDAATVLLHTLRMPHVHDPSSMTIISQPTVMHKDDDDIDESAESNGDHDDDENIDKDEDEIQKELAELSLEKK